MKREPSMLPTPGFGLSIQRERVLLIDSEDESRRTLQLLLHGSGFEVRAFSAAAPVFLESLHGVRTLFLARHLRDGDAADLLHHFRRLGWQGRAILIASQSHDELDAAAREAGFAAVVKKPVGRLELLGALAR